MLLFWLFVTLFVVGLVGSILSVKKYGSSAFLVMLAIVFTGVYGMVFVGAFWGDIKQTEKETLIVYKKTQVLINSLEAGVETNFTVYSMILDDIDEINNTIEKNQKKHDSLWVGEFYSKEVADLEPLEIDKTNLNIKL